MFIGLNFGLTGEPVTVDRPATGDPTEQLLAKDLDLQIPAETASTSNLVFSLRRCVNAAAVDVEIDSASGLHVVSGVESPTASDGTLVRNSDEQVTVHLAANAFDHLKPGEYHLELHEITLGGRVIPKYTQVLYLTRSASRRMS
ncbi:MAG: hypothetical protein Aurels2KO_25520 [Aureliella sp.]